WIALGGVLGGLFAAVIAPMAFSTVLEYPLLAATLAFFRMPQNTRRSLWDWLYPVLILLALLPVWFIARWMNFEVKVEYLGVVLGNLSLAFLLFALHRRRWLFAGCFAALVMLYSISIAPSFERGTRLYVA